MNKEILEVMASEALKVLSAKYGRTEEEIMDAAIAGNAKVIADLTKLVQSVI